MSRGFVGERSGLVLPVVRDRHDFDFKSSEISMILILKRIQNQNHFMTSYYNYN